MYLIQFYKYSGCSIRVVEHLSVQKFAVLSVCSIRVVKSSALDITTSLKLV